jgi:uncharacterized membrane protein YGL010W
MKPLAEHLGTYAAYHQDRRNVATHFVGIPLIVVGVEAILAEACMAGGRLSLATLGTAAAIAFYVALDRRFGAAMGAVMLLAWLAGTRIASQAPSVGLAEGGALFVVGWAAQFVGHWFEGRKPAFVDDVVGLLVGPLFLVAEVAFALGLRGDVRAQVERRAARQFDASHA